MIKREEVFKHIKEKYNVNPEYLWETTPDAAVFRHSQNRKWFALVINVNGEEYLNLKTEPNYSDLLRNTKVREEILRLKQNRLNREMLDESDVFQWYLDIARADIKDYVEFGNEEISVTDKQGNEHTIKVSNVNIKNDTEVDGILISEISKGKDGVKVKLPDKLKAMEWIADHMNLATEKQRAEIEVLKAKVKDNSHASAEDKVKKLFEAIGGVLDAESE